MGKGRTPCCDKTGLKKGPWTPAEDQKLIMFIQKYGHSNWRALPKQAGLPRCGKSCRLRWINYLKPDIKRGNFSRDEEETIIRLHESLGNKWSLIASHLPGRTDNEIKNVWNTHLKKKLKSNVTTNPYNRDINPTGSSSSSSSSTSRSKTLCLDSGPGIEEEGVLFIDEPIINSPLEQEASLVFSEAQKQTIQNLGDPFSLEDLRDVSSPSNSTCSSNVPHPNHAVQQTTQQEMVLFDKSLDDPFEELLEMAFDDQQDKLDSILDGKSAEAESVQETLTSGNIEESRKEVLVENGNWLEYLEYELGILENSNDNENHNSSRGSAIETNGEISPSSIDHEALMGTDIDPVAMYFQTWSSSSSSPPDSSLVNSEQ